jgi:hypothetical protein
MQVRNEVDIRNDPQSRVENYRSVGASDDLGRPEWPYRPSLCEHSRAEDLRAQR